jgi:hypothetical protein
MPLFYRFQWFAAGYCAGLVLDGGSNSELSSRASACGVTYGVLTPLPLRRMPPREEHLRKFGSDLAPTSSMCQSTAVRLAAFNLSFLGLQGWG